MHLFTMYELGGTFFTNDHFNARSRLDSSYISKRYLESVVSFSRCLFLKNVLWLQYNFWKSLSAAPK